MLNCIVRHDTLYVQDNDHVLTIIQVNRMVKKIYDYVMMSL
jgi:hypothetical protein